MNESNGEKMGVSPRRALPGGVVEITVKSDAPFSYDGVECRVGGLPARIVSASRRGFHVQVPEGAEGDLFVEIISPLIDVPDPIGIEIGRELARDLHIVANPAIDPVDDSIVTTRSGGRGQSMPVSLFRIRKPGFVDEIEADIMNPTGLAFDSQGSLFVSARADGEIWKIDREGRLSAFSTGLGIPTGIAFDSEGVLHVGDRTGTVYRVMANGDSEVLAKLDPSVAAFHLAFSPDGELYVTSPSISGYDSVQVIDRIGFVRTVFRGLGRPQGIAFDRTGGLYVVASYQGSRGIVRISPETGDAELVVAGPDIVGMAFRGSELIVATRERVYGFEQAI